MTGVAGYVAPRHLRAIRDSGNRLFAAHDPHDSVGVLDQYFADVAFFQNYARFERHLAKSSHLSGDGSFDYLSVCSPNFLHDNHVRLALNLDAHAICEKPLVINPWNLDALETLEERSRGNVYTILQLRVHPSLVALRERLATRTERSKVDLTYVTSRGPWYHYSWKGDEEKSGGLATNIGIHFFDLLIWLFGGVQMSEVQHRDGDKVAGFLELERADVSWFLSIDRDDLPFEHEPGGQTTYRSITYDGEEIEFSGGFTDLHTKVYEETLAGNGFRIGDARASIELAHQMANTELSQKAPPHPFLETSRARA